MTKQKPLWTGKTRGGYVATIYATSHTDAYQLVGEIEGYSKSWTPGGAYFNYGRLHALDLIITPAEVSRIRKLARDRRFRANNAAYREREKARNAKRRELAKAHKEADDLRIAYEEYKAEKQVDESPKKASMVERFVKWLKGN